MTSENTQAQELHSRFEELKSAKSPIDSLYKQISELLFPYNQGGKPNRKMWDATAVGACIKLASLLHNLITPFGQRWHKLVLQKRRSMDSEFEEEKQRGIDIWLDRITSELFLC